MGIRVSSSQSRPQVVFDRIALEHVVIREQTKPPYRIHILVEGRRYGVGAGGARIYSPERVSFELTDVEEAIASQLGARGRVPDMAAARGQLRQAKQVVGLEAADGTVDLSKLWAYFLMAVGKLLEAQTSESVDGLD